ncbi:DUF928 domain-containing protein [Anabaena sp. WFMT]|uniref:DUF928 domain-containing protein n=1 Tax=Anabaena sp. WFMT TaxID=3449730 RepID=UPI003F2115BF
MLVTNSLIAKLFRALLSSTLVIIVLISNSSQAVGADNLFATILENIFGYKQRDEKRVAPGRSRGGGGRGECLNLAFTGTDKQLTALVPAIDLSGSSSQSENQKTSEKSELASKRFSVKTYTYDEKPTLWFYIPYTYDPKLQLEYVKLTLLKEDKTPVTKKPIYFQLPKQPGIAQVQLPISLEPNKPYQWFFSVVCDENKPSRNPGVTGWIERRLLPPDNFIVKPSDAILSRRKYYFYYAQSELWSDAFTQLARAYQLTKQQNQGLYSSNFITEAREIQNDWLNYFKILPLNEDEAEPNKIAEEMANSKILEKLEQKPESNNTQVSGNF